MGNEAGELLVLSRSHAGRGQIETFACVWCECAVLLVWMKMTMQSMGTFSEVQTIFNNSRPVSLLLDPMAHLFSSVAPLTVLLIK